MPLEEKPKFSAGGLTDAGARTAAATSIAPPPCTIMSTFESGRAVLTMADFTSAGLQSGCCSRRRAATPVTYAVAYEGPLEVEYPPRGNAVRCTPGASTSGLMESSPPGPGPRALKSSGLRLTSKAPTAIALRASAGERVACTNPESPTDAQTTMPALLARSTITDIRSSG